MEILRLFLKVMHQKRFFQNIIMGTIMNRIAILIGASTKKDPIPGVTTDVLHWKDFLMSNIGGAWNNDSEIFEILKPTKNNVLKAIKTASKYDYALISFSGHGYVDKDEIGFNETFLCLNDDEKISERVLNPGGARCMIIMDCCHHLPSKGNDIVMESIKVASKISSDNTRYRALFEHEILKCEKGCTRIYSADINESAEDETSFTNILLTTANIWASLNSGVLKINKAMDNVSSIIEEIHSQQHPKYFGGRRLNHFPFAVNPVGGKI